MVLVQDLVQASQAKNVLAAQQYQKDLAKYNQDIAQNEKETKIQK